jgi:hypothetical protein
MPWHIVKRNNRFVYGAMVVVSMVAMAATGHQAASANTTQIGVQVCGSANKAASVDITEPLNDSVVNRSQVTLRANVTSASQVTVEIDGAYNGTIALGNNQTSIATDIALTEGTHTITLTANEVCGGPDASDVVVVTYQPESPAPSNGGTTPTQVGTTVTTEPVSIDQPDDDIVFAPILVPLQKVAGDFMMSSGLHATVQAETAAVGAARVGLTVVALTSVVMASSLAPMALHAVPGVAELFHAPEHHSLQYLGWIIRGFGILTLSIAYFL